MQMNKSESHQQLCWPGSITASNDRRDIIRKMLKFFVILVNRTVKWTGKFPGEFESVPVSDSAHHVARPSSGLGLFGS